MTKRSYSPHYEVKRVGDAWFFHVVASNGRTLCHSEIYHRRRDCIRAAQAVKRAITIRVVW